MGGLFQVYQGICHTWMRVKCEIVVCRVPRVTRWPFSKIAKNCRKTPKSKKYPQNLLKYQKWPKSVKNMIKVAKKNIGIFSQKCPKNATLVTLRAALLPGAFFMIWQCIWKNSNSFMLAVFWEVTSLGYWGPGRLDS